MRRYLWAHGTVSVSLTQGTVLAERYQVVQFPLLLDTAPIDPPTPLEAVPASAKPYLALSLFPVAIPRPFTQIVLPQTGEALLLLEDIPIQEPKDIPGTPKLLPTLPTVWSQAPALQQLTWLWQIARLWQPLADNQVAGTLLDWQNIRVDMEDIRLLSLQLTEPSPTLVDLGNQWRPLIEAAAQPLRDYLAHLVEGLINGQGTATGLTNSLTRALEVAAATEGVGVQFATYSDQGPTRKRNEDACYPKSGTVESVSIAANALEATSAPFVIVCDGIGGHQGGNVASQIAIDEVKQQLQALGNTSNLFHEDMVFLLEKAILAANQAISSRNDAAQRQERARMGTTIVIALVYGARLYIAHLGDSRAYRVRSHNCRQITLDDDVATREMRLGLQLYRDALQVSGSGALVQALGMASSRHLHPTVELYPLTQESLFLLCSDGLSDQDLVERSWMAELRPVVEGNCSVATAGKRLIELANTHNGHDNVTVGLLRVQPTSSGKAISLPADCAGLLTAPVSTMPSKPRRDTTAVVSPDARTTALPARKSHPLRSLLASIGVLGIVGVAGFYTWERLIEPRIRPESLPTAEGETLSPSAIPPISTADRSPSNPTTQELSVGDYLQVDPILDAEAVATVVVTATPPAPNPPPAIDLPERILPVGSIVQVINRQKTPDNKLWVRLEVCSVSTESAELEASSEESSTSTETANPPEVVPAISLPNAQPGDQGWSLETSVTSFADRLLDTSPTQQGLCTN